MRKLTILVKDEDIKELSSNYIILYNKPAYSEFPEYTPEQLSDKLFKIFKSLYKVTEKDFLKPVKLNNKLSELSFIFYKIMSDAFTIKVKNKQGKISYKRGISLAAIGSILGKDHSTVVYALKKFWDNMETYPEFSQKYSLIKSKI